VFFIILEPPQRAGAVSDGAGHVIKVVATVEVRRRRFWAATELGRLSGAGEL
jgi:hypothetical protein